MVQSRISPCSSRFTDVAVFAALRGPLKQPGIRRLLTAVRAAGRLRMTGAHWLAC
jgi:hypothetical protein